MNWTIKNINHASYICLKICVIINNLLYVRQSKFTRNNINYLQLQFLDGLVFELLANVAVVRKCFILVIYPSSLSTASLTLGTAVVATRSSTRVSTGEYFELGVSVGMLRKFQVKKKCLENGRITVCVIHWTIRQYRACYCRKSIGWSM